MHVTRDLAWNNQSKSGCIKTPDLVGRYLIAKRKKSWKTNSGFLQSIEKIKKKKVYK